ncbi:MAG: DEAD/DEAH box helicase [Candidatus Kapaibacterium sp.]
MNPFESLGIGRTLIRAISERGFTNPTPIQEQTIPLLLSTETDFVGLAQTGTGKTAAYGLPLLEKLRPGVPGAQGLVIAPTRELCVQISNDLQSFSKYMPGVSVVPVYGGANIGKQIKDLRHGAHIIVATPGRLIDLIERGAADITSVHTVVLDEADEMLNMGFRDEIDSILSNPPAEKHTWLFSATMPREVRAIASTYMNAPKELQVGGLNVGADKIDHVYYVVQARDRYEALKRLVDATPDIFAIVFCRTKNETQDVAERLVKDGYNADALHGDLSQPMRDKVMAHYRQRSLQLLVATDVAARGIDVNNVTHVINYNLPDEIENYTHRSGRTARAGRSCISMSLVTMKDLYAIKKLENVVGKKFHLGRIPGPLEVCESQLMSLVKRIHDVEVDEQGISRFLPAIREELKDLDKEELVTRFVSIEFNRFLEYYRNAQDINVNLSNRDHTRDSTTRQRSGPRMFINVGSMDGFDTGKMLRFLCDISGVKGTVFGKMDIKETYSFIDVEQDSLNAVVQAFNGEVYRGRRIRADVDGGGRRPGGGNFAPKGGGFRDRGNAPRYGAERPSYKRGGSGHGSGHGTGHGERPQRHGSSGSASGIRKRKTGG